LIFQPDKYDAKVRIELEKYWNPKIQEENKNRQMFDINVSIS